GSAVEPGVRPVGEDDIGRTTGRGAAGDRLVEQRPAGVGGVADVDGVAPYQVVELVEGELVRDAYLVRGPPVDLTWRLVERDGQLDHQGRASMGGLAKVADSLDGRGEHSVVDHQPIGAVPAVRWVITRADDHVPPE